MTTLRIGYTCHDRFPSTDTNTQQIFWTLYSVAGLGHTVELMVRAMPSGIDIRPALAIHYGAPGRMLPETLRISAFKRGLPNGWLNTAWFDFSAPRAFDRRAIDLLWTRDPFAAASAVLARLPVVFETFRPDFAGAARFAPWRWATLGRTRWDGSGGLVGVITHSHLAAEAFRRAGVPDDRCLTAHNGYAPPLMEPERDVVSARRAVGLPLDRPLLVYAGHVGPHKGTGALVDLARALPNATMVIVGVPPDSAEERWLSAQVRSAQTDNVLTVPQVPLADVATYLYAADCLVIPPTDEPLRSYGRTVLPMKVFSYLAAGRPILAPRLPDIEEVLRDGDSALLVAPRYPAAAAAAARRILEDDVLAARLSKGARDSARAFTWSARAGTIVTTLERWLARSV